MANNNQILVPQARAGLESLKNQSAQQLGISNFSGYGGDRPSRINGSVGGQMVKTMIAQAEQQLGGGTPTQ
jgi:hypothetical protein